VVGDQLLGVFDVLASVTDRFSDEDARTYSTLAAQVAVALRNVELYAEQMATVVRLRELDHLKSAFLANMSHELRTPMNSILGFTQVIMEGLDGLVTDTMMNDLALIEKNGRHLLTLINDILDMAKVEAGRLSLSPEPVNLKDLLNDVLETQSSLVWEKSLFLKLESEEDADLILLLDYTRMRQVFINLIGNAAKFTEKGGVTVSVEKQITKALIRIRDTGVGIPLDKLEMIFESFSQVDTTTTRKAGGTGLGLPISRRLVELHGGHLWAESTGVAGEGSTFVVELPITPLGKL
jgi:signal transduction histidine kinase